LERTREQVSMAKPEARRGSLLTEQRREVLWAAAFLIPGLIPFTLFMLWPIVQGFTITFTTYRLTRPPVFAGLANYAKLFRDPELPQAVRNTAMLMVEVVPIAIVASLILASLLNTRVRGTAFFRLLYFLPLTTSAIASAAIFRYILHGDYGLLNSLLSLLLGPVRIAYLQDPRFALHAVALILLWSIVPLNVIFYLAALQEVPRELLEAAEIDGAGVLARWLHITWPLVSPTTFMLVVLNTVQAAVGSFDLVRVLTQGGPLGATNVVVYYLYRKAFTDFEMGYASTIGYVLFFAILLLTVLQFRLQRAWVHY